MDDLSISPVAFKAQRVFDDQPQAPCMTASKKPQSNLFVPYGSSPFTYNSFGMTGGYNPEELESGADAQGYGYVTTTGNGTDQ